LNQEIPFLKNYKKNAKNKSTITFPAQ